MVSEFMLIIHDRIMGALTLPFYENHKQSMIICHELILEGCHGNEGKQIV